MRDSATLNAIIARNLAFWRQVHGYTLDGMFFLNTNVRTETLAAYEAGRKPALAAHLLQLAGVLGVPVELMSMDLGEDFYQTAKRSGRWYEAWCNLVDIQEEGCFEDATNAIASVRERLEV